MKGGRRPTKRTPERRIEHRRFTLSRPYRFFLYLFRSRSKSKSRMGKKKHDDACSKINMINSGGVASWSDLNHDVLMLVMMQLGVVDFHAFSKVCKSWRSLALCNRKMFMVSRPPMSISAFTNRKKYKCYLKDFEGRKLRITLPYLAVGSRCIGVTGGYLILFCRYINECWLLNLITRHELHFPRVPDDVICCPGFFRAILVFSPSIADWVFVVLNKCYHTLWFCIAGKQEWTQVSHHFRIYDVLAFKGKIYTLHDSVDDLDAEDFDDEPDEVGICEMRLYPEPKLVLLEIENFLKPHLRYPGFVSFGENLFVIDRCASKHPYMIHELDFCEMKLVSREKTGEKYAFFCNDFNDCKTFTLREAWADIRSQYGRYAVNDKNGTGELFHARIWYFFDECLNVDLIHE